MKQFPDNSQDAIVTDPPYELTANKKGGSGPASVNLDSPAGRSRVTTGFMGMKWDGSGSAFNVELWREAYRVLKPGAHLVAFGGTRTYHRMVVAIEDAGFEIRDQLAWVFGSGFPKSLNLEGEREGWGTALKPAYEPIVLARKPLDGTVAANVAKWGTGALNIDGCRVGFAGEADKAAAFPGGKLTSTGSGSLAGPASAQKVGREVFSSTQNSKGRWPANLCHDGSEEVVALFPAEAGAGGQASGESRTSTSTSVARNPMPGTTGAAPFHNDEGSAARFFYCAKTSADDREEGLEALEKKAGHELVLRKEGSAGVSSPRASAPGACAGRANSHPTVKPTELMRWLARLVTPPGGRVLDPFNGSGSTGKACVLEGFRYTGIDLDESGVYLPISLARILYALEHRDRWEQIHAATKPPPDDPAQMSLL